MSETVITPIAVVVGAGVIGKAIGNHLSSKGYSVTYAGHPLTDVRFTGDVRLFLSKLQGIDILVNAFGTYGAIGMVGEVPPDDWRDAIEVNLIGTYRVMHFALPRMAGGGHIINLAGGGAMTPVERLSSYGCSKAALVRLTETAAQEYPHLFINAISPGPVDSPMQNRLLAAGDRAGPWYGRILALREKGEGAVLIENTLGVIDGILRDRPSGELFFARHYRKTVEAA